MVQYVLCIPGLGVGDRVPFLLLVVAQAPDVVQRQTGAVIAVEKENCNNDTENLKVYFLVICCIIIMLYMTYYHACVY